MTNEFPFFLGRSRIEKEKKRGGEGGRLRQISAESIDWTLPPPPLFTSRPLLLAQEKGALPASQADQRGPSQQKAQSERVVRTGLGAKDSGTTCKSRDVILAFAWHSR